MSNNPFAFIFYPNLKDESRKDLNKTHTTDKQALRLENKKEEEIYLVSGIKG